MAKVGKKHTKHNYPEGPQAGTAGTPRVVGVGALRANQFNYNTEQPHDFLALCGSVRRWGIKKPIVVRTVAGRAGYEIIGGEHRWLPAQEVGVKKVPIFDLGAIDDATSMQLCIILNERGDADPLRMADLIRDAIAAGSSAQSLAEVTPFNEQELSQIAKSVDFAFVAMPTTDTRTAEEKKASVDPDDTAELAPEPVEIALTFDKPTAKEVERRLKAVHRDKSTAIDTLLLAWDGRASGSA